MSGDDDDDDDDDDVVDSDDGNILILRLLQVRPLISIIQGKRYYYFVDSCMGGG
jgi:hypothetical protein